MKTEAETRARLTTFGALSDEPALDSADVDVVLDMSKRIDRYGVRPIDTGWEPTYDHNYAVAQCWLVKATRLANRYLFMSGGKMFSRNQFYEHCMQLHYKFMARADMLALRLASETATKLEQIPNNANVLAD